MSEELNEIPLSEATQKRIKEIRDETNKQVINILQIILMQNNVNGNWNTSPDGTKLIRV